MSLATLVFETIRFRNTLPDNVNHCTVPVVDRIETINEAVIRIASALDAEGVCRTGIKADAAIVVSNLSELLA